MELHIPIYNKDKIYTQFELKKLKGGVIADATEEMASKGDFAGMLKLVSGSLKSLSTDDGEEITEGFEAIVKRSTIQTIEILSLMALTQGEDPGVEQISKCPRCKDTVIYEDPDEEDSDEVFFGALHFSDLVIKSFTDKQIIHVDLEEPIKIQSKKGELVYPEIVNITFRYPLLIDGIKGSTKVSETKDARRMYAIYSEAIQSVNGEEADQKFRNMWGTFVIERMSRADLEVLSAAMKNCGIQKTVKRVCLKCGKKWNDPIDLSGFFESGLQP